ncbi:MAG: DUF4249 domain-containing protein [Tunicatimonas sp.]
MQRLSIIICLGIILGACEDQISPTLEEVDPVLAVDAWITNQPVEQVIRLSSTQPYFDTVASPVTGATVVVSGSGGEAFTFQEDEREAGAYYWKSPVADQGFGTVGETYQLQIEANGQSYTSSTQLNPVPPIDSITYELVEANAFFPETYIAEFWATDLPEEGNAYWIRAYRNGALLNRPDEISLAYDAGFSRGGNFNATVFAQPIRNSINPIDGDGDGGFLPSYNPGDSVYVELQSISDEAFDFLSQVAIQTNRPGGFAELFANPIANVSTNITNTDPNGPSVVGFFNVASVSGLGVRIDE